MNEGGVPMDLLGALRPALTALFGVCLFTAGVDALFDGGAEGVRLACGLSIALCALRLMEAGL